LAARWGKAVVVENRPGSDGLIAINAFVNANDDHTLLFTAVGAFAVHPYTQEKLTYNADRDLLPIAGITSIVLAISTSEALKVGSVRELVQLARSQPGKLNAAAVPGITDFLLSGFLKSNGLQIAKVPYREMTQAVTDLAEGRIQVFMSAYATVQAQVQAGRVKVIAVTSSRRTPISPEIPTVTEAGFPALSMDGLMGFFGPRGMSSELRDRVAADLRSVAESDAGIVTRLGVTGQIINFLAPAEFAAGVQDQRAKLAAIAQTLGIKPGQ
jgi:tripartite-type tricarboxylate transporter receptor subunit TctC